MTGNGRNLTLVHSVPVQDVVVWVPLLTGIPWRDDELDRIPTDTERTA